MSAVGYPVIAVKIYKCQTPIASHKIPFYLNSYTYLRYYVQHCEFVTSKSSKSLFILPAKIGATKLLETFVWFFSWEGNDKCYFKSKLMVGFRKILLFSIKTWLILEFLYIYQRSKRKTYFSSIVVTIVVTIFKLFIFSTASFNYRWSSLIIFAMNRIYQFPH